MQLFVQSHDNNAVYLGLKHGQEKLLKLKLSVRKKKGDLGDFEHGMDVAARQIGLEETADVLGFSPHSHLEFTETGLKLSCERKCSG